MYFVAQDEPTLENVVKKLKIKRIKADQGSDSTKRGIIGIPGQDKIISVPCGVAVYNQNNVLLGECTVRCVVYAYSVRIVFNLHFLTIFFFLLSFFNENSRRAKHIRLQTTSSQGRYGWL